MLRSQIVRNVGKITTEGFSDHARVFMSLPFTFIILDTAEFLSRFIMLLIDFHIFPGCPSFSSIEAL